VKKQATEVIVLAGGLGSRLQPIAGNTPKCLMPVNGKPFLQYLLQHLFSCGFRRFVFALGHGHEAVSSFLSANEKLLQAKDPTISFITSIEHNALGTGGAIMQALQHCTAEHVLAVNGDSIFMANPMDVFEWHESNNACCTLLAKKVENTERFGTVIFNHQHRVLSFQEKKMGSTGYINAGVYWLHKKAIQALSFPISFSWEKDFLQSSDFHENIFVAPCEGYFIDIGIPEDYALAQQDFKKLFMLQPGKGWTLFLDRDGVINIEKENDYIHHLNEFYLYEDAISTIAVLSKLFDRIIVVTNQKGVGKGETKLEDLLTIHENMTTEIEAAGGKIDAIYFCPDLESNSPNRKPNAGMAHQAKADFPDIDFNKSIIVGNNISDMHFGRNAGMHTVFLRTTQPDLMLDAGLADMEINSLHDLIEAWLPA